MYTGVWVPGTLDCHWIATGRPLAQGKGWLLLHYNDGIMNAMASQITSFAIVYWTVYSRRWSRKTSKLRITGLCAGNSPVIGEFPTQSISNVENISIRWRHHEWPGPVFYLISWSPSHLEFFLQVTWSFSIFTPSDLEAKSLSEIPSDFGCWLGDILDHSNIVICILYLSKLIQVTLCGVFYNICTKGSQNSLHW